MPLPLLHADPVPHVHALFDHPALPFVALAIAAVSLGMIILSRKA